MIVFGDRTYEVYPRHGLLELGERAEQACASRGVVLHDELTALLVDAGEIVQGLLDARFKERGADTLSLLNTSCFAYLRELADAACGQCASLPTAALLRLRRTLRVLVRSSPSEALTVRTAEGYAYYGLYPEQYAAAARALRANYSGPLFCIGLRSVGTSLAAVVAAVTSAVAAVTVRPHGHPYQRSMTIDPGLTQKVQRGSVQGCKFAIIDEGPGLSGSSFEAVISWLSRCGVSRDRLVLFPSHAHAPGPRASAKFRADWPCLERHTVSFEQLYLEGRSPALGSYLKLACGLETGGAERRSNEPNTLTDVSGGAWREQFFFPEDYPPSYASGEQRKFLFQVGNKTRVAKFAGIGRVGRRKWERARVLMRGGFIPDAHELRHGFLVSEWHADARPLWQREPRERPALLASLAAYLSELVVQFPAASGAGAGDDAMKAMAEYNVSVALGVPFGVAARHLLNERLPLGNAPTCTDNRLHSWEWLELPNGRWLKADGLEHHLAHDLVGAQDIAWDVAGATLELDLSPTEQNALCDAISRASRARFSEALLERYLLYYLAFQVGYYTLARDVACAAEAARLEQQVDRYRDKLAALVSRCL